MTNSNTHFTDNTKATDLTKASDYSPTTVISSSNNKRHKLYAEYHTLYAVDQSSSSKRSRKYVDLANVTAMQTQDANLRFKKKASGIKVESRKLRLGKKHNKGITTKFRKMQVVEVTSDEEGYQGSWYAAKIVNTVGSDKYLVEYFTLKANDETKPLKEEVHAWYMRPYPPLVQSYERYTTLEKVDAWYNDGWWTGTVSKILNDNKYVVYFDSTKEEMAFGHYSLRPHLDWVDGQWANASKREFNDLGWKSGEVKTKTGGRRKLKAEFSKGMKVELKSDEEGYIGSWFSATIVEAKDNYMYVVEYETLKTDDETEFLKEEADASRIRPCPPEIEHLHPFTLLESVDAWYNEGWWEGNICKILDELKYAVYFGTSNEILEFVHSDLRPHQEWRDGKWISFHDKIQPSDGSVSSLGANCLINQERSSSTIATSSPVLEKLLVHSED